MVGWGLQARSLRACGVPTGEATKTEERPTRWQSLTQMRWETGLRRWPAWGQSIIQTNKKVLTSFTQYNRAFILKGCPFYRPYAIEPCFFNFERVLFFHWLYVLRIRWGIFSSIGCLPRFKLSPWQHKGAAERKRWTNDVSVFIFTAEFNHFYCRDKWGWAALKRIWLFY